MRLAALAPLAALLTSGCVLLPTLGGPVPGSELDPPTDVAPVGSELLDVRGIVHCHSLQSHDSRGEFEDIAAAANAVGCRFVLLTDHLEEPIADDGPDGLVDGVLFLPGFEARSRLGASFLGLGARAGVDRDLADGSDAAIASQVAARGGLCGLGHPEKRAAPAPWADAVELMNVHADMTDQSPLRVALRAIALPPGAFFRGLLDPQARAAHVYDATTRLRIARGLGPPAALGACDAHEAVRLLGPLGGAVDSYERVLRLATTHVLVERLDRAGILDALRRGRSYAACELDRSASGFRFEVRRGGEVVGRLGDVVPWSTGLVLVVEAPAPASLLLRREGSPCARTTGTRLEHPLAAPGAYRAEADLDGVPWIRAGAIVVREPVSTR